MRKRSLLSKTMTRFAACTALIFALTAPLFYLLTRQYYAEDMIYIIEAVGRGEAIPPIDLEADIVEGMMLQFLLIFAVVSLSLLITTRLVTRRLWLPFNDTLQKAERFNVALENLPELMPTDIREFDSLNNSLDSMMRRGRETFRIQKEFTENASHELQTPLAVMRSKLDLLMQENLTERQMPLVADLYLLTTRMSHLSRNLLLLARIDNAQYNATEAVDVAALVSESLPLYGVLGSDTALRMDDRRTDRHKPLRANAVLFECLLKNLVVNAIRHSAPGGEVCITLDDSRLVVSNTSGSTQPLDTATLFRRFSKGNTEEKNGNGLGLAIVKAVCDLHGWTVSYRFAALRHHFIINFIEEKGSVVI